MKNIIESKIDELNTKNGRYQFFTSKTAFENGFVGSHVKPDGIYVKDTATDEVFEMLDFAADAFKYIEDNEKPLNERITDACYKLGEILYGE